jgi:glycosyltransferase involved in cell wall biosynthesis
VTSGHVASAPRVVKEADALQAAGYEVHVVAADLMTEVRALDAAIVARNRWPLHRVSGGARWSWLLRAGLANAALRCWGWGWRHGAIARLTECRMVPRLRHRAVAVRADLYIGHNLPGLIAASQAARACGTAFAFDAEDDHVEEVIDDAGGRPERARRRCLLRDALTQAVWCSASSPLIAESMEAQFGRAFTVIRNVFPCEDASGLSPPDAVAGPRDIYWFSQTVGPRRGIEDLLRCVALGDRDVRLVLRGHVADGYRDSLSALLRSLHMDESRVVWMPSAAPTEMTRLAHGYALGASIEIGESGNQRTCLGNKIFQYLLAGTPVLLTPTPAQCQLATLLGEAGLLLDLRDPPTAAPLLRDWLNDPVRRRRASARAWSLAREELNWDREQHLLRRCMAGWDGRLKEP